MGPVMLDIVARFQPFFMLLSNKSIDTNFGGFLLGTDPFVIDKKIVGYIVGLNFKPRSL